MALVLCSRLTSKPDCSYVCLQVMQNDAAVFRTQSSLEEGCRNIDETVASFADVRVGNCLVATTSSCCVPHNTARRKTAAVHSAAGYMHAAVLHVAACMLAEQAPTCAALRAVCAIIIQV
eukprot:GHRQ01037613.1.p1 GENE.GHRQ01037613.1~~GHRQ01037613.1.p1  ORF type:complete len:128 (-),score=11.66 GHRQ01037613.1:252-611(-)